MKKDKFITGFYILEFITFLIGVYYGIYVGYALETALLAYALFYVINIYDGKIKKAIMAYLFFVVICLLIYMLFFRDASLVLSLFNLAIMPIFIYTYYAKRTFIKFKTATLFKALAMVLPVLLFFYNDYSLCFATIVTYPFLFLDRDYSLKNTIIQLITLVLIMVTKISLVAYPVLLYLFVITAYNFFKSSTKYTISNLFLLVVGVVLSIVFSGYGLGLYNSEVFGNELLVFKILKLVIAIIPFIYVAILTFIKFKKHKYKFNYEMLLSLLSIFGFVYLTVYLRLDYSQFIVLLGCLSMYMYYKFIDMTDKKPLEEKSITIMALHLGYGGIERYISSLTSMFQDYKINIISTYKVQNKPAFDYGNSKITYLMDYGPNKDRFNDALENVNIFRIVFEGIKSITTLINKKAYNIEAINSIKSKYVITTREFHNEYVGNYLDKRYVKIATEHNYHNDDEKYIKRVVNSVNKCNYFVLVSPDLEAFYKKRVNKKCECVFIPNVLDKSTKDKAKYGGHNIVNVGRLSSEKGQMDLVKVVERIKKDIPDVHLALVGDGPTMKEIRKYVYENNLNKNITLCGFKNSKEIDKILLESNVFVTTSFTESFGLSIIEAQNYSLPIVAFDTANGVKYLLKNGSGILVKNRDINKMAQEIENLFQDKSLYKKYSVSSKENANNYLASKIKPMWEKLIK